MSQNMPPKSSSSTPASAPTRRQMVALVVVCALLLGGAIGLNATIASLQLTFKKLPVPLRQDMLSIPAELGPWVQVTIDEPLPEEIEHELGTKQYIQRLYVDTRKADPEVLARWREAAVKTQEMRTALQQSVVERDPTGGVWVHIAYYTGGVDTVPHIPDRCMVAGGFDPVGRREQPLRVGDREITTSFVQFEQRAGQAVPVTFNVAYFFQVNGVYECDAITGVRKRLQSLTERYGYFAKIELTIRATERDPEPSQAVMADFLVHALPAIEAALPDWDEVISQKPAGEVK